MSLAGLFAEDFRPCVCPKDTAGLVEAACRGGWPGVIGLDASSALLVARDYLTTTFGVSVPALDLEPDLARRLAASLARNLGQSTTYKTIISDMFGAEEDPSCVIDEDKVRRYLAALKGMYIMEEVPGWAPPRSRQALLYHQAKALSC